MPCCSWENQDEGFVAKLLVPEGAQGLAVGTPVAVIVEEEEAVPAFKDFTAGAAAPAAPAAEAAPQAAAAPSQAAAGGAKDDSYYSSLPAHGVRAAVARLEASCDCSWGSGRWQAAWGVTGLLLPSGRAAVS